MTVRSRCFDKIIQDFKKVGRVPQEYWLLCKLTSSKKAEKRMQADTDFHLDDEQLYDKYISNLSLSKAITNYIQARTYEPVLMLGYGVVLAAKTPTYLISPGVAGQSWKQYFLFFRALGVRCDITRRELTLKLKQKIKNAVELFQH